ncbi:hybrid sensor histidine kinase/response regulator [Spirochaeta isovalerica]|uniref:histidine kinase n=1 Tax=Spirochaeta isovalerica TaxID=150 RepID=A0A841REU3_9SPIO|nr:ATP-binding protein [Spirochaeta isovalerica]MBB6481727.1 PAS domain S-box-containing protein [Spirochaeta isovalerica]
MPRHKKIRRNRSRFLVFNVLKMTFFIPLTILFLTGLDGPAMRDALERSFDSFSGRATGGTLWMLLLLFNILIYFFLKPVFLFNRECRHTAAPDRFMRKKAAIIYNWLLPFVIFLSIAFFLTGAGLQYGNMIGSMKDSGTTVPFLVRILESVSTGFFTGVILYLNLENLLFPAKKLIFTDQCEVHQKYSSFYTKLILSMTAIVFFLFFQIFNSLASFYLIGSAENIDLISQDKFWEGADLFRMTGEHEGLQDLIRVLFAKIILFCFYVFHILRQIKKTFKNPLDTVREKLEALNTDVPELSRQIDIVNNDEFSAIYSEINKLIDKQNLLLKSSEEKLEKIVEYAADPIISFHENGEIHVFNPAAEEFFGYGADEMTDVNMIDLIALPDSVRETCRTDSKSFTDYIINRDRKIKRFTGVHKSGKALPFEANVSISETSHGLHFTAIIRDVAGQIEFEETLKEARVQAENANRMKSEFLANMSHELRTPLNAVLGFTQLLSTDKNLTDGQLEKINTISRSGEHLLALINDILDISKIESGKTEVHETVFDLNRFVEDLKDMFILKCKSKGLSFYVEYAGDIPPYVIGDLGKLRQIMINIIGNAVKFTSEGGISILVGEEKGRIRFSVNDTGKGIPSEEIGRILQPFMQSSNVDHEGGTGLGLAITNSFINLLGGKLDIQSEAGSGSTFSFDLPLKVSEEAPEEEVSLGKVLAVKGNRVVKALIVDDKVNNRLILKTMLENVGFITMEAQNGQEAVERTVEFDPAMIFMDIKMPVMDGYEAVGIIKNTEQGKKITIFALTASAFRHDEQKIFQSGFDGFLPKPFKLESLYKIIADKTDVDFEYDKAAPGEAVKQADPDKLDFDRIAGLLTEEELQALDDIILINDFTALKKQASAFADRDGLADLVAILIRYADNFNDAGLENLIEEIRNRKNG